MSNLLTGLFTAVCLIYLALFHFYFLVYATICSACIIVVSSFLSFPGGYVLFLFLFALELIYWQLSYDQDNAELQYENFVISKIKEAFPDAKIFHRVYLSRTKQIDILVVTQNAAYIIDVRNYTGKISGRLKQRYWTLKKSWKSLWKAHFVNPPLYCKKLRKKLDKLYKNIPIYIVTGDNISFKKPNLQFGASVDIVLENIRECEKTERELQELQPILDFGENHTQGAWRTLSIVWKKKEFDYSSFIAKVLLVGCIVFAIGSLVYMYRDSGSLELVMSVVFLFISKYLLVYTF